MDPSQAQDDVFIQTTISNFFVCKVILFCYTTNTFLFFLWKQMTLPILPENIILITKYDNITPALEADLEEIARNQLLKYQDTYLKPFLKKTDAVIKVTGTFSKNKQEKYE
jgi:hypothetical protein